LAKGSQPDLYSRMQGSFPLWETRPFPGKPTGPVTLGYTHIL